MSNFINVENMKNKEEPMKRVLHTVSDLRVRENENGKSESRTITGYAILFNTPSARLYSDGNEEAYEVIARGAVTKKLLDNCDIKMTMFHDRHLILARSKNGKGTLTYKVDDKGVYFEFDAPKTVDGDKALELVRRGDIAGCSFMFTTHYYDSGFVSRSVKTVKGKTIVTYTVKVITGIYDFTLAADPAYPDTNCNARAQEMANEARVMKVVEEMREVANTPIMGKPIEIKCRDKHKIVAAQVTEMRKVAKCGL